MVWYYDGVRHQAPVLDLQWDAGSHSAVFSKISKTTSINIVWESCQQLIRSKHITVKKY